MRIEWFKAKGFRSLKDVEIDGFGPFNVFYGPNGAGKSNLLAAMRVFFQLLAQRMGPNHSAEKLTDLSSIEPRLLDERDRCQFERSAELLLGAGLSWAENEALPGNPAPRLKSLSIELSFDWSWRGVRISRLESEGVDLTTMQLLDAQDQRWIPRFSAKQAKAAEFNRSWDMRESLLEHFGLPVEDPRAYVWRLRDSLQAVARKAFVLIDADRVPSLEQSSRGNKDIVELLSAGNLKEALLRASKHPDAGIRKRYKQLGALLEGPPFHRPLFEMTEDPETGRIELVETVIDSTRGAYDIPLDLVGLGLAQIYFILARAMLSNARLGAIEEPEAHLHAPSTGMHLRQILKRLVDEGYLDQLFIATHSNLFDLDPDGYFDVSFDPKRGTQVTRKSLDEIDKRHLYEPGPAKHILQHFLRYMDENAVVFRRPDGSPVTIREMLDLLQRDDPLAKEFLDDVHGAAVRAVRVKHKTPTTENAR